MENEAGENLLFKGVFKELDGPTCEYEREWSLVTSGLRSLLSFFCCKEHEQVFPLHHKGPLMSGAILSRGPLFVSRYHAILWHNTNNA
jgi:hypothetical protein